MVGNTSPLDTLISRRTLLKTVGSGALALGAASCGLGSIKGSGGGTAGKIVIGYVSPQTGAAAGFASGDNFIISGVRGSSAYKSGFKAGGKTYEVDVVVKELRRLDPRGL